MTRKPAETQKPRLIVGISGASGAIYGVRLLKLLKECGVETHLIISRAAQTTLAYETNFKVADVERLASVVHSNTDIGAACSSGSFKTMGMVIAPCSIKTMSEIATGTTAHLMSRAASFAGRRRDHAPRGAFEQVGAQVLFQPADLHAQRRLHDMSGCTILSRRAARVTLPSS